MGIYYWDRGKLPLSSLSLNFSFSIIHQLGSRGNLDWACLSSEAWASTQVCPGLRGFPSVGLSVPKQGDTLASWDELVTLNLEEKVKCCLERLCGAAILTSSAAVKFNTEASQDLWKLLWISHSVSLEFWGWPLEPGQQALLYSWMFWKSLWLPGYRPGSLNYVKLSICIQWPSSVVTTSRLHVFSSS